MASLFVNQLTTLDFSFLCPDRGIVGETWLVDVTLNGDLDEQGMVFDFGHVKKQVKASLDCLADHRLLIPTECPTVTTHQIGGRLDVAMDSRSVGRIECKAPAQAVLLVDVEAITPEALTPILEQDLLKELPGNVQSVELTLYTEAINGAYFHYSHGLKKHLGNCQRIAHGHRSALHIHVDGRRDSDLETKWAESWKDIYIGTREDLQESFQKSGREYYRFAYTSDQGYFELTIAHNLCYLIDTDSTIELLADHIAGRHEKIKPGCQIRVAAFEGFNKGGIAER
ncbi:MAG: 6-pyruvoyl trahydropterin synthase family protein [Endozoicomonas sp.]